MGFTLTFIAIILFSILLGSKKLNGSMQKYSRLLVGLFIFKCLFSFLFYALSFSVPSVQKFLLDSQNYFNQGYDLYAVFKVDKMNFFRLLFGWDTDGLLAQKYLSQTTLWEAKSWMNDNRIMIRINALLHFISFRSYWFHIVFFNFLSFLGIVGLGAGLKNYVPNFKLFLIVVTIGLPTLLYATGQPMKESVVLVGLGFFMQSILCKHSLIKRLLLIGLALFVLLNVKQYVLILMILALAFYGMLRFVYQKSTWVIIGFVSLLIVILCLIFSKIEHEIISYVSYKQDDMVRLAEGGLFTKKDVDSRDIFVIPLKDTAKIERISTSEILLKDTIQGFVKNAQTDYFYIPQSFYYSNDTLKIELEITVPATSVFYVDLIQNDLSIFYKSIPRAFINGMFRPFISEATSWVKALPIVEYLFCYFLVLYAIWNRRKLTHQDLLLIGALLFFALGLFLLTGLAIQVTGAIVRYRIFALLALICISFVLLKKIKWEWIEK